jgi:hypothetical protein
MLFQSDMGDRGCPEGLLQFHLLLLFGVISLPIPVQGLKVKVIGDHQGISGIEYVSIPALKIGGLSCGEVTKEKGLALK